MPLILQHASKDNAAQRVEVQLASYIGDPILLSMMPGASHEDKVAFFVEAADKEFGKAWIKDLEILDTDTGKVVAFARWKYPSSQKVDGGLQSVNFPPGTNMTLVEAVFEAFKTLTDKYYDPEKMYFLSYMHVLPEYQRRGLGQQLMEQALKDADRDDAQAFLLATDAGKRLYAKFGFKSLEEKDLDFLSLGACGKRNTTAQIREPERKM